MNLGGSTTNAKLVTVYTGLQIQSSAQGKAIPIVWGANTLAPNLIWQENFQSHKNGSKGGGKGGGAKGAVGQYTYSEALILAMAEGPIDHLGAIWTSGALTSLAAINLSLATGTAGQSPPAWITSTYPGEAQSYAYTAYLFSSLYTLSAGATLPSLKLEVCGAVYGRLPLVGIGATADTPANSAVLHFPSAAGVVPGMPVYCTSSRGLPASTFVVSVSGGDVTVSQGMQSDMGVGNFYVFGYQDASFADIINDFLTNVQYGVAGFPAGIIDPVGFAFFQQYCLAQTLLGSPVMTSQEQAITALQRWTALCNTWIFESGGALKFVPLGDTALSANGGTYTPYRVPVYSLTLDDFIFDPKNETPVTLTRIDPIDGYNRVQLDARNRNDWYADTPVYWEDQASIDQFGMLQSNTVAASEICDLGIAGTIAALIGQRSVFQRNTYTFKLPYTFVLLEPGDIVLLNEPFIGLVNYPVRVRSVDEDDAFLLTVVAEESPGTLGNVLFVRPAAGASGMTKPGSNIDPGAVNPPLIFEPAVALTGGVPEIWIGASGGSAWGGAQIYASVDGTNYVSLGEIATPTQQGVLTAVLPVAADPDLSDTLAVNMAESGATLSTAVTTADADAQRSIALVDSEIIGFGAVAPTGASLYSLTYLRRGMQGTPPAAHAIGALFSRINPASVFTYTLPKAYVGVPLYFKFLSFNTFGGGLEDISTVTQYTYVPTGVAFIIAAPTAPVLTTHGTLQPDGTTRVTMDLAWTASAGPSLGGYEVQFSADGGTTWPIDTSQGAGATTARLTPAISNDAYQARVRAISANGLAVSAWAISAVVISATIAPISPPSKTIPLPLLRHPLFPPDEDPIEFDRRQVFGRYGDVAPQLLAPLPLLRHPLFPPDEDPIEQDLRAWLMWRHPSGNLLLTDSHGNVTDSHGTVIAMQLH